MADAAIFRRIALSFDGATEYPHFDRRAFKARVTFATLAPDELSANIKFAPDEQALKCAVAPDAFMALDNAWGRRGWTRATLAALSEAELRAALEMAWRHGAAKAQRRRAVRPSRSVAGNSPPPHGRARCERFARLPQPFRRSVVARGGGGLRDLSFDEILRLSRLGSLRRRGEVDDRIGALLGRDDEASS